MYRAKKDGNSSGWPLSNLILTSDQVLRYSAGSTHGIIEQLKTNERLGDYGLGQWMPEKASLEQHFESGSELRMGGRLHCTYGKQMQRSNQLKFYRSTLCGRILFYAVLGFSNK